MNSFLKEFFSFSSSLQGFLILMAVVFIYIGFGYRVGLGIIGTIVYLSILLKD